MFKYFISGILGLAVLTTTTNNLDAAPRKSYSRASYSKKAPYAGYGKPSKVNGLPKCKTTSGYTKRTSKGYTYVNPYARSK